MAYPARWWHRAVMTEGSILITGASTGIGEAWAQHFNRLG